MADYPLITDDNYHEFVDYHDKKGKRFSHGLIQRNFKKFPVGYESFAKPIDFPLFSDQEIEDRLADQLRTKSSLEEVCMAEMPILDQDGYGYCWGHSTVNAVQCVRGLNNQPYEPLSAFAVCAIIKRGRNEGGWCTLSLKFVTEHGVPSQKLWPQGKANVSTYDTPAMRENAKKNIVTEWFDLSESGSEVKRQLATLLLMNVPVATDYNWWGHSVLAFRLLSWNPFRTRIKNSWAGWGNNGMGDLEGSKAIPNGAVAPCLVTPNQF